jgi:hypothetical protein
MRLDVTGGHVVVTRFACPSLLVVLHLLGLHVLLARKVRQQAPAVIAVRAHVDWRRRQLLSISLWRSIDDIYTMGNVSAHVQAARLPGRLGVQTSCGVFTYVGDWQRVMFGAVDSKKSSPLSP